MTRIIIATPSHPGVGSGNGVTALRWHAHLSALGHSVELVGLGDPDGHLGEADLLVALHGRHSAAAVKTWRHRHPERPVVIGLTGTDLYTDMPSDPATMANAATADALIVLQPAAVERLNAFDPTWPDKTHVIHQSVEPPLPAHEPSFIEFRVVVLAHLRTIKDPLLAARAASMLAPSSRITVHHGGRAMDDDWLLHASAEATSNRRYVWHGELNRNAALELLASADVLACTSIAEGGANVVSEAIAMGVPVIGTRMAGNVGLLGDDHPGLFPVGDELAMSQLLSDLEADPAAVTELAKRSIGRQHLTDPATERAALDKLVQSLCP